MAYKKKQQQQQQQEEERDLSGKGKVSRSLMFS